MSYFAAALARNGPTWSAQELDLEELPDLDSLTEALRDLEPEGPALLLLEQDDEWLGVVRIDGDGDPRVFLSDRRAAQYSEVAAMLWDATEPPPSDGDDEDDARPIAEPVGDATLLADLGTSEDALLALCAHEGMLPGDVLSEVGERAGFGEALDSLRGA